MEECVKLGLAKSIGLSNFNSKQIKDVLDIANIKPVNNQVLYHIYFKLFEAINLNFILKESICYFFFIIILLIKNAVKYLYIELEDASKIE